MDEGRSLFAPPVFRLAQMQVFNWGTFTGLHTIPVAERGHLFVGPSGSGKSTLMDVFTTLLVPPAQRQYNVAAREGERSGTRDRSLASYVRGVWAEAEDSDVGRSVQQYLRQGATWSAIALTYRCTDGRAIVLTGIYWMKASTNDVSQLHLIFDAPFDLRALEDIGPEPRALKRTFSQAFSSAKFSDYAETLQQRMHMPSPMALRLLQKAQSAKNLGDLNLFLRDFMLDPPQTFDAAKELVGSFQELEQTHQAVVNVRRQIQHLIPARENLCRHVELDQERKLLLREQDGLDRYFLELECDLLDSRINILAMAEEEAKTLAGIADRAVTEQRDLIQTRQHEYETAGGMALQLLENDIKNYEENKRTREPQWRAVCDTCKILGLPQPNSAEIFARMQSDCRAALEQGNKEGEADREEAKNLVLKEDRLKHDAEELDNEIKAMESQPSLIPSEFLAMRANIARALSCQSADLPFAGELMEVEPEHSEWRGAIERVLRTMSLSILVADSLYKAFTRYVNSNHLGRKLEYHWTREKEPRGRGGPKSLFLKLRFAPHEQTDWLKAKVAHNFHYICVDDLTEFREEEYALTREGLSRSGKSRHVKDDSRRVDDERHWVMGLDNHEKLEHFRVARRRLEPELEACANRLDELQKREIGRLERNHARNILTGQTWDAIDVAGLVTKIHEAQQRRKALLDGAAGLARLFAELEKARALLRDTLEPNRRNAEHVHSLAADKSQTNRKRLSVVLAERDLLPLLDDDVAEALGERRTRIEANPSPETLVDLRLKIGKGIGDESRRIMQEVVKVEREITNILEKYKEEWSVIAADFQPTMNGMPDFLEHLERLEREELVRHEQNFLNLLRQQGMQRLVTLSDQLERERRAIHERLALVNEGLKDKEYNPGSHIRIRSQDLHDETVRQFKEDMAAAFAYTLGSSEDVEPSMLEERFLALSRLVSRLKSQDPVDARWRELVLDVRRHVEFIGLETIDATGEVRTHRGSQGKSGGQRQKLTATCLAAALRYQLGGVEGFAPTYTTVVLDEAFDKADHHFTRQVMTIFASFGFQMIVSTPMKSVRTLEPFIGGACVVNIRDERYSSVCAVEYDETNQRLDLDNSSTKDSESSEFGYIEQEALRNESDDGAIQSDGSDGGLVL